MSTNVQSFRVVIADDAVEAGREAGAAAAVAISDAIRVRGKARVVFASAPSQSDMLQELLATEIDWRSVEAFHMDEYIGIDPEDPRAFATWLAERLPVENMAGFQRINSLGNPKDEAARYEALLRAEPIDVTLMGFGMNGHIAFNEPGSDLYDPAFVRTVELDLASRGQQVVDGLFAHVDDTPTHAISLTVPALLSATKVISTVVGTHKARAVQEALHGPISSECPASAIRRHPDVMLFLDPAAASGLRTKAA